MSINIKNPYLNNEKASISTYTTHVLNKINSTNKALEIMKFLDELEKNKNICGTINSDIRMKINVLSKELETLKFNSDLDMLNLQLHDINLYRERISRKNEIDNEILKLTEQRNANTLTMTGYVRKIEEIYKEHGFNNYNDFKKIYEYYRSKDYLLKRIPELDFSLISVDTIIKKAHMLYNEELIESEYYNAEFVKRIKIFHAHRPCAYKGGRLCNCGNPITFKALENTDWLNSITFDSNMPVGELFIIK